MTYIIKHLNNGNVGVYDTVRGCYPIAGPELRAAGISRLEGTGDRGWFKKSETDIAERIAADLNAYYNHVPDTETKVSRPKVKAQAEDDSAMADMAAALVADQA